MKFTNKSNYSSPQSRKALARFLHFVIDGHEAIPSDSVPYMPNEGDTTYWTLDGGNNWKLKFYPEQPEVFEIIYRYQCEANPFEEALAGWLKVRIHAEPVE